MKTIKNKMEETTVRNLENEIFKIYRGINISHWLSQNPDHDSQREQIFKESDVEFLSKIGYDHLRIPVDEVQLWDEQGNKMYDSFILLHNAIKWCMKYNLKVIIDLHQIRTHTFDKKENILWTSSDAQTDFVRMWLELSKEFIKYPVGDVAYELLNEAVADKSDDWNNLISVTIDSLRKKEINRKIIVGSNRWQSPDKFDELKVPANDKNIILSFHFYTPFIFTHYKALWTETGEYEGSVHYPGKVVDLENISGYKTELQNAIRNYAGYYDRDTLLKCIEKPILYAKKYGLQLYCGEFGCLPSVHRLDRLKWYEDVRYIFETNNIAWSNWDYKGAFSIYNLQNGSPDEKLISVLLETNK